MFAVVATDTQSGSNRLTASIDVTVTVTDVSETPAVTGDTAPSFSENASTAVATYTAADPERDTLTWSVDGDGFWISDRGQLHFAAPPSFEDGNTTYQVTVTAADDSGLSDSLDVTVTVTDTEEAGTVRHRPAARVGRNAAQRRAGRRRRQHQRHHLAVGTVPQPLQRVGRHLERHVEHLHRGRRRRRPLPEGHRLLLRRPGQQQDGVGRADGPDPGSRHQARLQCRPQVRGRRGHPLRR